MENDGRDSVARLYIAFEVCFNLLFWVPIFYVFQKQSGLTDNQIFSIQSLYYLFFIGFEIPTGFLADVIGHRKSMILAALCLLLAHFPIYFSPSYQTFLVHFLGIALARAFASGSASAYLYGYLEDNGRLTNYKKIESSARSWGLMAKVLAWSSASYLTTINLRLPYDLTLFSAGIALVISLFLKKEHKNAEDFRATVSSSLLMWKKMPRAFLQEGKAIRLMILCSSFFVLARMLQVHLFQPYLLDRQVAATSFGLIMAAMTVSEATGTYLSGRIKIDSSRSDLKQIFLTNLLTGFAIFGMAFSHSLISAVIGLCLFSLSIGLAFPPQKKLIVSSIKNAQFRASLLSLESMLQRTLCSLLVLLIGAWVENHLIEKALIFCGSFSLIFAFIILILGKIKTDEGKSQGVSLI